MLCPNCHTLLTDPQDGYCPNCLVVLRQDRVAHLKDQVTLLEQEARQQIKQKNWREANLLLIDWLALDQENQSVQDLMKEVRFKARCERYSRQGEYFCQAKHPEKALKYFCKLKELSPDNQDASQRCREIEDEMHNNRRYFNKASSDKAVKKKDFPVFLFVLLVFFGLLMVSAILILLSGGILLSPQSA